MKNETTGVEEFFVTPEVNEDTEDVVLMSDTEVLEAATVIAQVTASDEKFPFYLHYDANQKEFLLSVLTAAGATIESDDVDNHILSVRMNMTQMKLVRYQDCVERVRTDEGMNTMLADEVIDEDLDAEIIPVTAEDDNDDLVNTSNLDNTAEVSSSARAMMLSEDEVMPAVAGEVAMTANNTEPRSTCCCPTNTTMETAKTITVESLTSGYICCPGTPQWFKFTVPQTAEYTIYTTGDKDTRGALYGSNGQRITHVDDYEPCGKVNFRIIQELQANETYYVRVDIAKSGTGDYYLKVTQKTLVNKVNVTPNVIVLDVGETYELPILPDTYVNLEGTKCVTDLVATVVPSNAAEHRIMWGSSNTDVLRITAGWHNDQRYYAMTAVSNGVATLRAYDWNNHGKVGECNVTVRTREKVYVRKDGDFNKIVFGTSGKVWYCINYDLINDWKKLTEDDHRVLYDRLYRSTYTSVNWDNDFAVVGDPISYTDNEMRLLYMLDPLGLACYVQEWALKVYEEKDVEELKKIEDGYGSAVLNYKNSVFKMLFGRAPKYYSRNTDGKWEDVTDREEEIIYKHKLSEAELLFGTHPIYDYTFTVQAINIALQIIALPFSFASLLDVSIPDAHEVYLKYVNLSFALDQAMIQDDFSIYIEALTDQIKDDATDAINDEIKGASFHLGWAQSLFELSDSFGELADIMAERPSFYKELFETCMSDDHYRVYFEYNDGTMEEISDICNKLNLMN